MKLHRRIALTLVPSALLLQPWSGMAAEVLVESGAFAECRLGREAQAEFNESLAPLEADRMHHGNSPIFRQAAWTRWTHN